jgi:hypothetical protein
MLRPVRTPLSYMPNRLCLHLRRAEKIMSFQYLELFADQRLAIEDPQAFSLALPSPNPALSRRERGNRRVAPPPPQLPPGPSRAPGSRASPCPLGHRTDPAGHSGWSAATDDRARCPGWCSPAPAGRRPIAAHRRAARLASLHHRRGCPTDGPDTR